MSPTLRAQAKREVAALDQTIEQGLAAAAPSTSATKPARYNERLARAKKANRDAAALPAAPSAPAPQPSRYNERLARAKKANRDSLK